MPKRYLFLLLIVFFRITPALAMDLGQAPWQITADTITHSKTPESVLAEGHVILTREQPGEPRLSIESDWLNYDVNVGKVTARGNVHIRSAEDELFADEVIFDLYSQTGILKNTTLLLQRDNLHLTGSFVEKTGADTYVVHDGWVSACRTPKGETPAWSFASDTTRVTVDGYAILESPTLEVKDVPVFYLPYLILPAKTTRQTGFLFPEISQSSRSGAGLMTPLFLNLTPSSDMTLYPGFLSERGFTGGLEFRYAASVTDRGTFAISYLNDHLKEDPSDEYKSDGYVRTEDSRYWLRGKADHEFGDGIQGKLDFDVVSDRDYLEEFRSGLIGFDQTNQVFLNEFNRGFQEESVPFRESSFQLTKAWSSSFLGGEMRAVDDETDAPSPTTAIQTLPRFIFAGREGIASTPIALDWTSEYVHYWRKEGIGEQRLDLHPRFTATLPLGKYLENSMSYGLRESLYQIQQHGDSAAWTQEDSQNRTLFDFSTNVGTSLMRDFELPNALVHRLNHLVRPELSYAYIPAENQEKLPFLDALDRVQSQNQITTALGNFFWASGRGFDDSPYSRLVGRFKVSESYDLREEGGTIDNSVDETRPFSDILLEFETLPFRNASLEYDTSVSVYGQGVTSHDLMARYTSLRGDRLTLDYRYSHDPDAEPPYFYTATEQNPVHELNLAVDAQLLQTLSARYQIAHSWETDRTVDSSVRLNYHPSCWAVEFLAAQSSDDRRVALIFSLTGIGRVFELGRSQL